MAFGSVSTNSRRNVDSDRLSMDSMQAMEVVGYGFRIKSHGNPFLVIPFVIQYFFIVCVSIGGNFRTWLPGCEVRAKLILHTNS